MVAVVVVEKVIVEVVGINIELYLVDAVADGDALPRGKALDEKLNILPLTKNGNSIYFHVLIFL